MDSILHFEAEAELMRALAIKLIEKEQLLCTESVHDTLWA